jgi:hypothetical protein
MKKVILSVKNVIWDILDDRFSPHCKVKQTRGKAVCADPTCRSPIAKIFWVTGKPYGSTCYQQSIRAFEVERRETSRTQKSKACCPASHKKSIGGTSPAARENRGCVIVTEASVALMPNVSKQTAAALSRGRREDFLRLKPDLLQDRDKPLVRT